MTITEQQWEAAAADAGMTLDELRAKIAEIDGPDSQCQPPQRQRWSRNAPDQTGPPRHFDRQGDPLTSGEWAALYEWARSYRFIAESILPNRYWIATIWTGTDEHGDDDPPIVMETSVFYLNQHVLDSGPRHPLPLAAHRVLHATEADAVRGHAELVAKYSRCAPPVPSVASSSA